MDGERFLREAERWIIDIWGYGGELLKTEPLVPQGDDNWHELGDLVDQEKLVEPPLWSADLLVSTPPLVRNWQSDKRPLDDWALGVREADHRAEIFPSDSPSYVVVDGTSERRMRDRVERIHVSSALVEPATGRSLVRALQTMGDSWDYKLPDEGEDRVKIDQAPYWLLGWLQRSHRDEGIDDKDPFRGYAFQIASRPGQRVTAACDLIRDAPGRPRWSNVDAVQPMFDYVAWGVPDSDNEQYRDDLAVAGQHLRAHNGLLCL